THEKRIANFFADRIIEICDGKVVRDEENQPLDSYERSDDSNIYLKEMVGEDLASDNADLKMFFPKHDEPKKIQLTMAWKDNKLYIQNNMPFDILIEGVENGVEIKDEERPKIDLSDVENFEYELPKMKSKGKSHLPAREIWNMAMENIRMMGKKQAFVIGILIVTAVLLSITMAQFVNSQTTDATSIRSTDSHYVSLKFTKSSLRMSYDDEVKIADYIDNELSTGKFGDLFFTPQISMYLVGTGYQQLGNLTQMIKGYSFADPKHLSQDDLIYGRLPEKRNEIAIDKELLDRAEKTNDAVASLHDSIESYLGTKLVASSYDTEMVIVGIVDTQEPNIYCSQTLLLGMNPSKGLSIATCDELAADGLVTGKLKDLKLKDNQVLIRQGLYDSLGEEDKKTFTLSTGDNNAWSEDTESDVFEIVGTFSDDAEYNYVATENTCKKALNSVIFNNKTCLLYTDNPQKTAKDVAKLGKGSMSGFELNVTVPADDEVAAYIESHSVDVDAKQLITLAIVAISLIMVYFTIKSNAVSRIEELTVYRLIGISKGSILKAYMLEMILMTCYTSLPAVLATSVVIKFISSIPSLQISMIFPWWSVLLLLVGIYAVHIFISILPVYGILSKPPATLAVKE
ncbi:MAG: hypothetical protein K6G62_02300, partial [Eubacterium sp.]|nr:hypothetical protein [Eubacterium sp.]